MNSSIEYAVVNQADDVDDAPVIVDVVQPLTDVADEKIAEEWTRAKWAGCVGATTGCLVLGGFVPAVICGTGCIYAAKQDGSTGDFARGCGKYAMQANVMAREIDERHQVVNNTKKAAIACWTKAKTVNDDYEIVTKTKGCVVSGVQAGVAYTREHNLVERAANGVGNVISTVAREIASSGEDDVEYSEPEITITDASEADAHHHAEKLTL